MPPRPEWAVTMNNGDEGRTPRRSSDRGGDRLAPARRPQPAEVEEGILRPQAFLQWDITPGGVRPAPTYQPGIPVPFSYCSPKQVRAQR